LWAIATVAGEYSPHRDARVNRNSSLQRTIFALFFLNILQYNQFLVCRSPRDKAKRHVAAWCPGKGAAAFEIAENRHELARPATA
jgi:hypothetical protein